MTNMKYSYMSHWSVQTPAGGSFPSARKTYMDRFLKEIEAVGFRGIEVFARNLPGLGRLVGGTPADFEKYMQDIGLERMTGMFKDYLGNNPYERIHDPACHDTIFSQYREACELAKGTGIDTLIVMPSCQYIYCDPVTEDQVHHTADLWNRVGKMSLEDYGIHLSCHHEFWCGMRDEWAIEKFYEWTDPKYVFYFCDTAQHTIAGLDPVALYDRLADRTWGFHLKDTNKVDTDAYRTPPDAEFMAKGVNRWFYEAGEGGLVDFPALFRAMKKHNFRGWVSLEHDEATNEGGTYASSTAVAAWYVQNVLDPIMKSEEA